MLLVGRREGGEGWMRQDLLQLDCKSFNASPIATRGEREENRHYTNLKCIDIVLVPYVSNTKSCLLQV